MDDAPSRADFAKIVQVAPPTDKPDNNMRTIEKVLVGELFPNGSFQLREFYGAQGNTFFTYQFPPQNKDFRFKIEKEGICYLGAYKYTDKRSKLGRIIGYGDLAYGLEPIKEPSEKELLTRLLKRAKGTVWEERTNKRLGELK